MATSGIAKSWVVPNGRVTDEGNSYAGAYYSWEWTSAVKSPGVTTVTWKLYGRGRPDVSPRWLLNECYIDATYNGSTTQIYTLPWAQNQSVGNGTNTCFYDGSAKAYRTTGSFDVNHDVNGAASFTIKIKASMWAGENTGGTTTTSFDLDTNYGTAVLTLDKNGGTGGGTQTMNVGQATAISTSITASRSGYKFLGWNTKSNGTGTNYAPGDSITLTSAKTLYANWSNYYTVTYSGNGATSGSVASTSHNAKESSALSSGTFTRVYGIRLDGNGGSIEEGAEMVATYTHAGWTYGGVNYAFGQSVSGLTSTANGTVTMQARWTGGSVILPGATRNGYRLLGWSTNSSATSASYRAGDSYTPTADTYLYAVWATLPSSIKRIVYIKVNNEWKISNQG